MNIRTTRIYHGEWMAVDDDTYDGAEDGPNQCGVGSTEQEAVDNLIEKMVPRFSVDEIAEAGRQGRAIWQRVKDKFDAP